MIFHEASPDTFVEVTGDLLLPNGDVIPWLNLSSTWGATDLAAADCYRLGLPSAPSGKLMASYTVERVNGVVQIVPVWVDLPLDTVKANKAAAIDATRDTKLTGGYTVPSAVSTALAGKVLQTRDVDDRTNWLTSQAAYSAQVSAGNGATLGANFRGADNVTVTVSYSEGLNVLLSMAAWGSSIYGNSWSLKDQVTAAADAAAVAAIDETTGWPA